MNRQEAVSAVYQGKLVECSEEEYRLEVRNALQEYAGKCIDTGEGLRAMMALEEVKRLDRRYPSVMGLGPA